MDPYAISLADVFRILEALDQTGGDRLIQGLKNRTLIRNIEHGRVTLGMILQLLDQTDGCTTLPDNIVEMLRRARLGDAIDATLAGTQTPVQLATASSTWGDALTVIPRNNRISIESVEQRLLVLFSPQQRMALQRIPFATETLRACANTHVLFPGFPITIEQMVNRPTPPVIFDNNSRAIITLNETIKSQQPELRWYLLRCGIAPKSTYQNYDRQIAQLPKYEEAPRLAEVIYGMVLKAMVHECRLFQRHYVRCSPGTGVTPVVQAVGHFTKNGFMMTTHSLTSRLEYLGLASMRKLNT